MKKWIYLCGAACLSLALLTACGQGQNTPAAGTNEIPEGAETLTCRVVREDDGSLILLIAHPVGYGADGSCRNNIVLGPVDPEPT